MLTLSFESCVSQHLPRTIMAVFVHHDAKQSDVDTGKKVHTDFLKQFGITSNETPLVSYNEDTGEFAIFEEGRVHS